MQPCGLCLKKQGMNSCPVKGVFSKGPGEFSFALLERIAPLTRYSQLYGSGKKPQGSAAIKYLLDTSPGAFLPITTKAICLKTYLPGLPFCLFLLVTLPLAAVICCSITIIPFAAIMCDAA